ncbi:hypothetical protein DFH07DRAFT_768242 [Mycena maculata]|uniref:Uncharacterized protein n=1 Tax=Mycena maculata TaxID=230809 RepID=A0AAD7JT80_9AGAR|nr:hypothetical protein DFH07DRAFT_768242 [Mycena maculata]
MCSLPSIHVAKTEYNEAHIIYAQIVNQVSVDNNPFRYALAVLNTAEIEASSEAPRDNVLRNIENAKAIFQAMGYSSGVAFCDLSITGLNLRQGDVTEAQPRFEQFLKSWWGKEAEIVTFCLQRLGDPTWWTALNWLPSWTTVFLAHALKSKLKLEIHKAIQFLGDVFLTQGDEDTAIGSLFTVALDGFTFMDVHQSRAECMLRLGDISKQHGDIHNATQLWQAARPLFKQSSQIKQVAKNYERLDAVQSGSAKELDNLGHLAKLHAPISTLIDAGHTDDQNKKSQDVGTQERNQEILIAV